MSLYQCVTGTALVLLYICTGTVGTVGTLVPATLCLCTNMLLVLHWYYTGTAVYMYWYCGYCWYIGTSHSMCLCLYITGTTLVVLFICTGTVGTGGTHSSDSIFLYQYVTGTALVLLFICTGTVGTVDTLVPASLCLFTNGLLVLHWYCLLYVLVLWVLLVLSTSHSMSLYQYITVTALVLLIICTGTAHYMYWYCGYCWYIGTSHSMSLYQYFTGTALVLLFICTGSVGTVGTLV